MDGGQRCARAAHRSGSAAPTKPPTGTAALRRGPAPARSRRTPVQAAWPAGEAPCGGTAAAAPSAHACGSTEHSAESAAANAWSGGAA